MNLTLAVWLALFCGLTVMALQRPIWACLAYMLTFFASPPLWWWGGPVASYRWALYGGFILLGAVVVSGDFQRFFEGNRWCRVLSLVAIAAAVNASGVHFLLADNTVVSSRMYTQLMKFILLFLLMGVAIKSPRDLRLCLWAIALGIAYIGYEVTINGRGGIRGGRLEGVGVPGGESANELASMHVTLLPVVAALFLGSGMFSRGLSAVSAALGLNTVLLCNSRGAFIAAISSGLTFLAVARGPVRKKVLGLMGLGIVALFFLLGDARIIDRFSTTFADSDDRDASAASRLKYWEAGLMMVADYPLGAGGDGFGRVHGPAYIRRVTGQDWSERAVHNGYINMACEWGIQGLALHLAFLLIGLWLAIRAARTFQTRGHPFHSATACAVAASLAAFMLSGIFGNYLDNEWGFWTVALAVVHSRLAERTNAPVSPPKGDGPVEASTSPAVAGSSQ